MCMFKKSSPVYIPAPTPAPTKTSAEIQAEAEKERMKNPLSTAGFAANILTSGLGDTSKAVVSGVTLGM